MNKLLEKNKEIDEKLKEANELDQLPKVYKCINNSLSNRLISQQEKFDSYEYKIKNNIKKIKKIDNSIVNNSFRVKNISI